MQHVILLVLPEGHRTQVAHQEIVAARTEVAQYLVRGATIGAQAVEQIVDALHNVRRVLAVVIALALFLPKKGEKLV